MSNYSIKHSIPCSYFNFKIINAIFIIVPGCIWWGCMCQSSCVAFVSVSLSVPYVNSGYQACMTMALTSWIMFPSLCLNFQWFLWWSGKEQTDWQALYLDPELLWLSFTNSDLATAVKPNCFRGHLEGRVLQGPIFLLFSSVGHRDNSACLGVFVQRTWFLWGNSSTPPVVLAWREEHLHLECSLSATAPWVDSWL